MKISIVLAGLVLIAGVAFAMNEVSQDKTYSWRYKMTVEVETPEGIKSGSAVREVTVLFTPNSAEKSGYYPSKSMKGEAVVVDLGERGKVFATQNYDHLSLPFRVFDGPPGLTLEGAEYYSQLNAKAELDVSLHPMFVTFKDMNDPLSVQLVYGNKANKFKEIPPYVFQNNFETVFGEGVKLKSVTIEMTDEPVVYKVKEFLPWLDKYRNKLFDGRRIHTVNAENRLANRLGAGSFTTAKENNK